MKMNATAQNPGKVMINAVLLLIFLVMTVILGVVWLNNIKASYEWHKLPRDEKPELIETAADAKDQQVDNNGVPVKPKKVHGFTAKLDWTLVDYSTATTFILFYGFALIFAGLLRIGRNNQDRIGPQFPFSEKSDQIIVNLGLIGTIWGLIMIGFYNPETINMPQLIICLKTAMWSTLLALVWVYLIQLAVIVPVMRWWNESVNYIEWVSAMEEVDLEELLNRFCQVIRDSSIAMVDFRGNFAELTQECANFLAEMMDAMVEIRQAAADNSVACQSISKRGGKQDEISNKQYEAIMVLNQQLTASKSELEQLRTKTAGKLEQLDELVLDNAKLTQALETIRTAAQTRPAKR